MSELSLDFYGWVARLNGDAGTLDELRRDFAAFVRPAVPTPFEELELIREAPPPGLP